MRSVTVDRAPKNATKANEWKVYKSFGVWLLNDGLKFEDQSGGILNKLRVLFLKMCASYPLIYPSYPLNYPALCQ